MKLSFTRPFQMISRPGRHAGRAKREELQCALLVCVSVGETLSQRSHRTGLSQDSPANKEAPTLPRELQKVPALRGEAGRW
jgi:hypothetical protein